MKSWAEKVATEYHRHFTGKVQVVPKCAITSYDDFAIYYTPGVAEPCREIVKDIEQVYELTNRANMVAVVSDGTRVLGLGDIGPEAALPVMEVRLSFSSISVAWTLSLFASLRRKRTNWSLLSSGLNPLSAASTWKILRSQNVFGFWKG
jgi:hypothetical protein